MSSLGSPDDVPGVEAAISIGLQALESLTGEIEYGDAWPEHARRGFVDTRWTSQEVEQVHDDERPTLWFVKTPWPEVGIEDVLDALDVYVASQVDDDGAQYLTDANPRVAAAREFFALGVSEVRLLLPRGRR